MKAKISRPALPEGRRILAISDVHGNLPYLQGLLQKLRFSTDDVLVFVGDIIEKGPQSLQTLRFIMRLCRTHTVYAVKGNCDGWQTELDRAPSPEWDDTLRSYIVHGGRCWNGKCILAQMCDEIGFPRTDDMDLAAMRRALRGRFAAEFAFLDDLPTILDTAHYTFVHGGLPEGPLGELDAYACMKNDAFLTQGRRMDKWCIVGHWPVMLYGRDITCANPIISREQRIASIDGGCVLKDDGQLNALIIPYDGSEDFRFEHYDHFPVRRVKTAQAASGHSTYIRWGDNIVRVLSSGAEFSFCEHVRTGYRLEILTKYLRACEDGLYKTNDCTDYVLPLAPGDEVSVVEETSRGYLVKHDGVSGWYFGALE